MLNEKKIKLMTKCAIYEKRIGHEDLERTAYCASDYVRLNIWKSVIGVTISVVLAVILWIILTSEELLMNIMTYDFKSLLARIITVYIVLAVIYIALTIIFYSYKYKKSKDRIKKYAKVLEMIEKCDEAGTQPEEEQ